MVTEVAPNPTEMKVEKGTKNMLSRAQTTIMPLQTTVCIAVVPTFSMARSLSSPLLRSSR